MAVARRTVTVTLDEELVDRARARSGAEAKPDADVIEEAVAVYLGMKALDEAQAESGLTEEGANRLAYEELHAMRPTATRPGDQGNGLDADVADVNVLSPRVDQLEAG